MTVAEFLLLKAEHRAARLVPQCKPGPIVTKWPRASLHHLLPPGEQKNFSILVIELPPRGQTAWRAAARTMHELAVMLSGKVVFKMKKDRPVLGRNDSVYFDLMSHHRWLNPGTARARVLLLNPNFTEVPDVGSV